MENKKQFCILCGAENKIQDRFCHSCGQPLEQTDDELQEYVTGKVKEKTKEKAKEKATDTFLEWLKKLLNSKAYGIILSLSIVVSGFNMMVGLPGGNGGLIVVGNPAQVIVPDTPDNPADIAGLNGGTDLVIDQYAMFSHYVSDIFAVCYEDPDNINEMYLWAKSSSTYAVSLKATGAGGNVLVDVVIARDTDTPDRYTYVINERRVLFEMTQLGCEDPVRIELQTGAGGNMLVYREYKNGRLMLSDEYYENGNIKYSWNYRGEDQPAEEYHFNEDGTPA